MSDFDELPVRKQVVCLRRAAKRVLDRYGVSPAALSLLAHHRQTTFKATTRATGRKYVLRFHRDRSAAAVRSEFSWLRQLRKRGGVVIPEPISTLDGEEVVDVNEDQLPGDLRCSVTAWVEGRRYFRKRGPGARVLREVGRILATMHLHAERFVAPPWFDCPVRDWEGIFRRTDVDVENRWLCPAERRLFAEVENRTRSAMDRLKQGRETFGVIHGDLMQANYLVHQRRVHVIDFADLGLGHFLYDMSVTLFPLWGLDDEGRQRQAFLTGYRETRKLSLEHERLLNIFIAARGVVQARFVMASNHPGDQAIAENYLRRTVAGLKAWLV
ncbi:MAG TPA: phosphotransferase [Pirellulales bacterium]|nr:phosphotransferase [Pirellulales bacterium]